nr:MAG TPA: hypothetical protein [Caudoviricetes sp.]
MYTYSFNFASVTNQQAVARGYKNGCTTVCRTIQSKSAANIVQTFLIS